MTSFGLGYNESQVVFLNTWIQTGIDGYLVETCGLALFAFPVFRGKSSRVFELSHFRSVCKAFGEQ